MWRRARRVTLAGHRRQAWAVVKAVVMDAERTACVAGAPDFSSADRARSRRQRWRRGWSSTCLSVDRTVAVTETTRQLVVFSHRGAGSREGHCSREGEGHLDVAASCVGIRADLMGLVDQLLSECRLHVGEGDLQGDSQTKATIVQ
jgi:hypothetical protein